MNRFRAKKKAKEAAAEQQQQQILQQQQQQQQLQQQQQQQFQIHHQQQQNAAPEPSPLTSLPFLKSKKKQPETKPNLDLSGALPSSDDFRTSLLMPKMSARFSMLREQDDPNSKLGKANDDSVLHPRRQSRLNLFGASQLGDISEVSSLSGSARPSFANGRASFASGDDLPPDGDASPGTSMMNRSRPGEGNNLFGGRQKIYKISPRDAAQGDPAAANSSKAPGKALYEDDVTLSAFQKLKQKEREQRREEEMRQQQMNGLYEEHDTHGSTNTENSGLDNRTSTSTTSTDSQTRVSSQGATHGSTGMVPPPLKPTSGTKTRRLYGQGPELQRQQSSALNRIENHNRQRAATNDSSMLRSHSRSAVNLSEKYQKTSPLYASSNFRPSSPPPSATSSVSGATDTSGKKMSSGSGAGPAQGHSYFAPWSPPVSENGDTSPFAASLQPEDRGKATATGLFNRPAARYDEEQFSKRQIQMFEGRNTPPFPRLSPSRTSSDQDSNSRSREFSMASNQSKTDETGVSKLSASQNERPQSDERSTSVNTHPAATPPRPVNGTFLANFSGSESDDDDNHAEGPRSRNSNASLAPRNPENIHPAFRNSAGSGESSTYKSPRISVSEPKQSDTRDLNTIEENESGENANQSPIRDNEGAKDIDSPTLGPTTPGAGLSGMIRTHLRHGSDKSSIYPHSPVLPPAEYTRDGPELPTQTQVNRSPSHATSVRSNPFEYDDWNKTSQSPPREKSPTRAPPPPPDSGLSDMSMRAKQMLGQANALSAQNQDHKKQPDTSKPKQRQQETSTLDLDSEQEDLDKGHLRSGSSETQKDREEFANELAERRRKVQEKLRGIAESESRSASPGPGHHQSRDFSPGKLGNSFASLKNKPGKNNSNQPKHMRILGIEDSDELPPSRSGSSQTWRDDEERMFHDFGMRPSRSASPYGAAPQNRNRPHAPPSRTASGEDVLNSSREDVSTTPPRKMEHRDRSFSDSSGRSKSRTRHRDEMESVRESTDNIGSGRPSDEDPKPVRGPNSVASSARPSLEAHNSSNSLSSGGRFRSNSRPVAPTHLETSPAMQAGHGSLIGATSPRPSPVTPYSANTTPPLFESPAGSPATTPGAVNQGAPLQGQTNQRIQGLSGHKRQVDKWQISEPKLVSSTNNAPTVGLPPGASLSNGAPPVPPMNPRRRQTTAQTILGAFKHSDRSESSEGRHHDDLSTFFSDDDKRHKPRHRIRKISSEGGNMNIRVRQQALGADSPPVPPPPREGAMF